MQAQTIRRNAVLGLIRSSPANVLSLYSGRDRPKMPGSKHPPCDGHHSEAAAIAVTRDDGWTEGAMMNRRGLLLGGTALAAAVTFSGAAFAIRNSEDTRASDEVVAWFKANALPIATAGPGSEMHDIESTRAIIGNARIVSLGEATHGTREFFQLKHRLMEYCVSQLGFTIIAFEADYGATLAVNDYVLHGKGTAADVVAGMGFQIWDTEEVVALVEWVRAWNLANERKVKFYGFDMQSAAAATLHLLAYLERVAPELADASARDLAPLAARYTRELPLLPEAMQQRTAVGI